MITAKLEAAALSAKLWFLLLRLRDPRPFYKTWAVVVTRKAKANARAKGGRTLWKNIADSVLVESVSARGANISGSGPFGRIGAHKQTGGKIRAKNKTFLTIPLADFARGKTAGEVAMEQSVRLFRPGPAGAKKRVLGFVRNGRFVPVFALCRETAKQAPDKWYPDPVWVLQQGIAEAHTHLKK